MKKTIKTKTIIGSICVVLVVTALLFAFTACGGGKTDVPSTTKATIKETASTVESTTEKEETTVELTTEETVVSITDVVPSTTKIQEITTQKPVTTTSKPVTTTQKPTTTSKPVTTAQNPTTTEVEYYPALTQADMEELVRYGASYIESRGYWANPELRWDNAGYMVTTGLRDDLSCYGDEFKIVGGAGYTPLEYAKSDLKGYIDYFIESCETDYGPGYIDCMYPLVRRTSSNSWQWTIGFWLAGQ